MCRTRIAWMVALGCAGAAPAAAPAAETCNGEKVTISFRDRPGSERIVGTQGDDVILGGPRNETITGGRGEDTICGGDGHDTIDGGPGRDQLYGQDDTDVFVARSSSLAEDIVVGGAGPDRDVADYRTMPVGIRLNQSTGLVQADGSTVRGGIQGIERVEGTNFDDELIGNAAKTTLVGWDGKDFIDGRAGNDKLYGGDDVDTVSYAHARERVRISVEGKDAYVGEDPGREEDVMEEFEIYIGSKFNDRLVGADESEKLVGGPGDDTLRGWGDGDTLEGGPGDDTIYPGEGDDLVDGGTNEPVRGVGAPGDLVSYQPETGHGLSGSFDFEAYLTESEYFHDPPHAIGVGDDPLVGIESIRGPQKGMSYLEGDAGPNILIGGSKIDVIVGNAGNDLLFGLGSDDAIDGNDGDDYLDGGEPHSEGDTDKLDGGNGDDTCLGAREDYRASCETVGR